MKNAKNTKNANVETNVDANELFDAAKIARSKNANEKRFRAFCRHANNVAKYDIIRNKKFTSNTNEYKIANELIDAFTKRTQSRIVTQ